MGQRRGGWGKGKAVNFIVGNFGIFKLWGRKGFWRYEINIFFIIKMIYLEHLEFPKFLFLSWNIIFLLSPFPPSPVLELKLVISFCLHRTLFLLWDTTCGYTDTRFSDILIHGYTDIHGLTSLRYIGTWIYDCRIKGCIMLINMDIGYKNDS